MVESAVESHLKGQKHLEKARFFGKKPPKQQRSVDLWMKQIPGENSALRKKLRRSA